MSLHPARVTLRQLCHLGLPAPVLLPSLLPVLRELVPASHAGFFFCDERGGITNLYAERMLGPNAMAGFHDRHTNQQFRQQYLERVAARQPTSRRSVSEAELSGTYGREVLGPLGIAHLLYAIVRHQGQVLGQLSLYRGPQSPAFSADDEQALASVLHYLGQGLAVPSPALPRDPQDQAIEQALALLDAQGGELWADENWSRLIRLAHGNAIAPASALAERETLPGFVAAVMHTVLSAPQAVHQVVTSWGRFEFRRHAMRSASGDQATALLLSRLAAEPLRLAQGAAALGLSPQQREVAVLIARGHSNAEIASQLAVSTNTAAYHVKQVFARLGVHERSAIARVLGEASGGRSDA
ncbi:helix-turn-helix transcriptional regulator [Aquabacterium sp. OR-4]|uniref:helix-turn-helix transcriptional regulator n=1 Tax=Aquabacterium sp. OR-4 TaxID=2978127 RepID=UPI0028C56D69|nr:LuxR C-terminal-related transcriptional regulator [Aquabacterium sp. OR-4]MDT7838874.1 LuxR C-terminal-related transcriptional regulator [Aquabacterium sp. OR-4]